MVCIRKNIRDPKHYMQCDMCGKNTQLFKTKIEGTILNTCKSCSEHGNILKIAKPEEIKRQLIPTEEKPEITELIVTEYARIIRDSRERLGMKQEDLAKKIAEKESIIHKIETGNFKPSMKLAKKLERFLNVKIIEEIEGKLKFDKSASKEEGYTIGDMIKVRKR